MTKTGQNPDASFNNLYTSSNFALRTWSMKPSKEGQQQIVLMFGMPKDLNKNCPMELTLYFFVDSKPARGDVANVRIQSDTKANYQQLGVLFASTTTTGNFSIVQPSSSDYLENIIVSVPLTVNNLLPGNWVLLVFDRVAPTGENYEYDKDIYLTSAVLRYASCEGV